MKLSTTEALIISIFAAMGGFAWLTSRETSIANAIALVNTAWSVLLR